MVVDPPSTVPGISIPRRKRGTGPYRSFGSRSVLRLERERERDPAVLVRKFPVRVLDRRARSGSVIGRFGIRTVRTGHSEATGRFEPLFGLF